MTWWVIGDKWDADNQVVVMVVMVVVLKHPVI